MENIEYLLQEALSLCQTGRFTEGKQRYLQLLALAPDNTRVLANLGALELQAGNLAQSIAYFGKSLSLNSNQPILHYNYAMALQKSKRYEDALATLKDAIALNPDFAQAYNNRGAIFNELQNHVQALASYDRAIQLNSDYAEAYNNRGITLSELERHDEALADYERAIALNPDYAEAYSNRGITLSGIRRYDEALADYDRAIQLNPEIDFLLGYCLHTKMHLCDWGNYKPLLQQLLDKTENNKKVSAAFSALVILDDPSLQKKSAECFVKEKHPSNAALPNIQQYPKHAKIRIGYFSADFHHHATMHLMAELFEYHDKHQFECIAFSFGPDVQDEWRQSAIKSFDQFIDVRNKSDIEVAQLARALAIDIAIDLKGYTKDSRAGIFAYRAAPIQVNYLGYPGTMGADYMDYLIADYTLIPEDKRQHYTEKIVYLPNSYQANMKHRVISDKIITRQEMGLPENAFVFCSFNNNYKITPTTFDGWMRILQQVAGSVLWIFKSNETAVENLKKEALLRGVDSNRLIFASYLPVEEHLKRIQLANLFLDTLPCNAHTTASDALRVGLPILTLMGGALASRVAASLLNAVNLPELITTHQQAYESLAIALANNPVELQHIKNKLKNNLTAAPLYDSKCYTQHLECAYQAMYQRYQADVAPDHIHIKN